MTPHHLESPPENSMRARQSFCAIATALRTDSISDAGPQAATTKLGAPRPSRHCASDSAAAARTNATKPGRPVRTSWSMGFVTRASCARPSRRALSPEARVLVDETPVKSGACGSSGLTAHTSTSSGAQRLLRARPRVHAITHVTALAVRSMDITTRAIGKHRRDSVYPRIVSCSHPLSVGSRGKLIRTAMWCQPQ